MIYVTSDLHLCHNRDFLYEPRGFKNIYEHDEAIVSNWNSIINPEDDVYILGDLMLNDNERGRKLLSQLKGNLHIVFGNHDTDTRIEIYNNLWNVVEICGYATVLKYNGYRFYLSHYPTLTSNFDDKALKTRTICLCGHTHTKDAFYDWEYGVIYHCELDAHNNYPVSIEQIIKDMKEKVKECKDMS